MLATRGAVSLRHSLYVARTALVGALMPSSSYFSMPGARGRITGSRLLISPGPSSHCHCRLRVLRAWERYASAVLALALQEGASLLRQRA
jgi:hypothetical protein